MLNNANENAIYSSIYSNKVLLLQELFMTKVTFSLS